MSGFITADGAAYLLGLFCGQREAVESYYVALVTRPIGIAESGAEISEPTDYSYSRAEIINIPEHWYIYNNSLVNTIEVGFPIPTEPWSELVGYGICDSPDAGQVLFAGDFPRATIDASEQFYVPAGGIIIDLDLAGWMNQQ